MAFTTAPLPMDKDQGAFWQGGEELFVTNDNFFDQYVSFETVEPTTFDYGSFGNPPSPSILLDSLDCLTNSPDSQSQPPAQHRLAEAAARPGPPVLSSGQHARSVPALYDHQSDVALGRASISDSELLRLEGISLRSPGINTSASSSPRPVPSSPLSPRRNRRFLDAVHATVRRPPHRPTAPVLAPAAAPHPDVKTESGYHGMDQQPQNVANGAMDPAYGPIDCRGLPLSPPLTGKLPTESQRPRGTPFVTGHLEDPFGEGYIAPHPPQSRAHGERAPLCKPVFRNASQPMDLVHPVFQPHKQRSTSSAEWPAESPAAQGPRAPWAAGHMDAPDGRNRRGPDSWAEDAEGTPAGGHPLLYDPHGQALRMHHQRGRPPPYKGPYEPVDGLSGLAIHMPQPQPPLGAPATPRRRATAAYPSPAAASSQHRPRGLYTDRRPLPPRTPTSGARHFGAASLTSPRKPSVLLHSASRPLLAQHPHDESPASPTPTPSSATASRRRSSSMSVRKQRSWSRREPRPPNIPASSLSSTTTPTTPFACSPGLGGGGVDFVNFTPSDKTVLMQGVAPSGSSKTKARREKEALDRRRKLSEAAYKAVQAAGGDLERLKAEVSSL